MPNTQTVFVKKTVITDAQIKVLPTSPTILIPAIGAGKVICPVSYIAVSDTLAGGYTNLDTDPNCLINIGLGISGGSTLYDTLSYINVNTLMADATKGFYSGGMQGTYNSNWGFLGNLYNLGSLTPLDNQPLVIGAYNNLGNFTGGNSANTLSITIAYTIVDL